MRHARLAPTVSVAFLLLSCASEMIDGIPLYGRVHDVPAADISRAIALVRTPSTAYPQIYAIEVVSSTEIHLHHAPYDGKVSQYNLVEGVKGKWRFDERVIGPPTRFRY